MRVTLSFYIQWLQLVSMNAITGYIIYVQTLSTSTSLRLLQPSRTSLHICASMPCASWCKMHGSAVRVLYHCKSFNYATFVVYVWASIALLYVELCFREYSSSSFSPGNKVPHTSTKVWRIRKYRDLKSRIGGNSGWSTDTSLGHNYTKNKLNCILS